MGCSEQEKTAWANGIGLAKCIADEFCAQYGRLPASIAELDSWGNSTGRRTAAGWVCLGTSPPAGNGTPVPGTPSIPTPSTPTIPGTGGDIFNQALAWAKANPIPTAVIALFLIFRKR